MRRIRLALVLLLAGSLLAEERTSWQLRIAEHADQFEKNAAGVASLETLVQRSYNLPPHARFAIGKAATAVYAQYLVHELISEYGVGRLKSAAGTVLVERREAISLDGQRLPAVEAPREQTVPDLVVARKRTLERLVRLGLNDVATEYALILLAFTTQGQKTIEWSDAPAREEFVGSEEALVYDWTQAASGALEFLRGKTTVRPMRGSIWLRKSDGAPLRVHVVTEHAQKGQPPITDTATIEYADFRALGCVAPVSVVHRHFVDGQALTENLYTYNPFRLLRPAGDSRRIGPGAQDW